MIARPNYIKWLHSWKGMHIIKVISGIRRCGKSTLFRIFVEQLRGEGVPEDHVIYINFEDLQNEHLLSYHELYTYINARISTNQKHYIFLDEIQNVAQFERVVDSLFLNEQLDIYLTGSNAYFMSGQLATVLSGRYVELNILPLSFREFANSRDNSPPVMPMFEHYLALGGFPYIHQVNLPSAQAQEYIRGIYSTVILKDVMTRLGISNAHYLELIAHYLFDTIGSLTSLNKIANTLKSNGSQIDAKTVSKYVRALKDALIIYEAKRYNIKGRKILTTNSKYYLSDLAFRQLLVKKRDADLGHQLENIVYLELARRYEQVYVGDLAHGEVDFVAINASGLAYYQVSASVLDSSVLARELKPLRAIQDNYPKYLLTLDSVLGETDYQGIEKLGVVDWLRGLG